MTIPSRQLALGVTLLVAGLLTGDAVAREAVVDSLIVPAPRTLLADDWDALHLARAVTLVREGRDQAAIAALEEIDVSAQATFANADRAAFLLAVLYQRQSDRVALARLVTAAGDAQSASSYRRWVAYLGLQETGRLDPAGPTDVPGAVELEAALLLEHGRAADARAVLDAQKPRDEMTEAHLYLRALAGDALGEKTDAVWAKLAKRKPETAQEADLIGAAALHLAADDPPQWLGRVPEDSRYQARARHARGLLALAAGDTSSGVRDLEAALAADPAYAQRGEVLLELGAVAAAADGLGAALVRYDAADSTWRDARAGLDLLDDPAANDGVWRRWQMRGLQRDEIRLATDAVTDAVKTAAVRALDLRVADTVAPRDVEWRPAAAAPARAHAALDRVTGTNQPTAAEWDTLRSLSSRRAQTVADLARQDQSLVELQDSRGRRHRYLTLGWTTAGATGRTVDQALADLTLLQARLDSAVAALDTVRDRALARFAARGAELAAELRRNLLFARAVQHFHVDGPTPLDALTPPAGTPSAAELLAREMMLSREMEAFLTLFALRTPDLVYRSCDEVWRPRLVSGGPALRMQLNAQRQRADGVTVALGGLLAGLNDDPVIAAATARRDSLAQELAAHETTEQQFRLDVARSVAERGRRRLDAAREAIDYHRADAAYWLAVALATDPATAEDRATVAPARDTALAHLAAFLERHPASPARSETRFRRADLELLRSRDEFQQRMASFLDATPTDAQMQDRSLAPFVEYGPAIELYAGILVDDPDYPHTDAVLFNLGMILADDGQPGAEEHLERLVAEYPGAVRAQEAWLRMGDLRFERRDFAASVVCFENAAAFGGEPELAAIALYKLGWAELRQDRFAEAALAFGRLLDLSAGTASVVDAGGADLATEAEDHLVHALIRAGGATAFAAQFAGAGGRPYEAQVLSGMSRALRDFSLYAEAAECDQLWLDRYPTDPAALAVSERLADTYERGNHSDLARAARLTTAPRFLPGSAWHAANTDPDRRAAGEAAAQGAYRGAAEYHHRAGQSSRDPSDWRQSLDHYHTYLSHWPTGAAATRMHYQAGEAASALDDHATAHAHFTVAAADAAADFGADAAWQLVAVSDAWYRSTAGSATTGADSLAATLLAAGDAYLAIAPADERAADLRWRQANLAYAHGWDTDAATRLDRFSRDHAADPRAPRAAHMAGDALYRQADFAAAGPAYMHALVLARTAGADSTATVLARAVPHTYYRRAEQVAAADSVAAAPHFMVVADRWPTYEHADVALYRAGLGYAAGGDAAAAIAAWERVLSEHAAGEYGRDAALQVAQSWETAGEITASAAAYERFSALYQDDPDAPDALLHAADLLAADDPAGARRQQSLYLERFPGDWETAMAIRGERAGEALASVAAGTVALTAVLAAGSELQAYLDLAVAHPEEADPRLLAAVDFQRAEASLIGYRELPLNQPLPEAIAAKQARLEELIALYGQCAERGDAEYARAAAYRTGEAIVHFGDALLDSERPADLAGDDLLAYDEVLEEQSWTFHDRGEAAWSELLRQCKAADADPGGWIARTQTALWPRLARRFVHQPALDYPLVAASQPPARRLP